MSADEDRVAPKTNSEQEEVQDFVELLNGLGKDFDYLCAERHKAGQKEYGTFTFLGNDVTRMMLEELADTVNYCRMQAIKLMLLQEALEEDLSQPLLADRSGSQEEIVLGIKAFRGVADVGWKKDK